MSVLVTERGHTVEELLRHPDGDRLELVDGRFVEKSMGTESGWIASELSRRIGNYCRERGLGRVFPSEVGYQCFTDDGNRVRKPDVSFVRADRLPSDWRSYGFFPFAPDLAIEIISPNDLYSDVRRKIGEYLDGGIGLVWVVDPLSRHVEVYRADGSATLLREESQLSGEELLPGFECPLRELFDNE